MEYDEPVPPKPKQVYRDGRGITFGLYDGGRYFKVPHEVEKEKNDDDKEKTLGS